MILGMVAIIVLSPLITSEYLKKSFIDRFTGFFFRDNDRSSLNCASMLKGGWWWKSCGRGLNGLYLNDPQDLTARQGIFIFNHIYIRDLIIQKISGIVWFRWRGWDYTLKKAMMMIKPKGFVSTT